MTYIAVARAGDMNDYYVPGSALLDWFYGTQGLGLPIYVDDVFAGHEGGLPGLVERVEERAAEKQAADSNSYGHDLLNALRAELGMEEPADG